MHSHNSIRVIASAMIYVRDRISLRPRS